MDAILAAATGSDAWTAAVVAFASSAKDAATFDSDRALKADVCAMLWQALRDPTLPGAGIHASLTVCKILMRERRDIAVLLSTEAFDVFLRHAARPYATKASNAVQLEAIRCMVNAVYIRPAFVEQLLATAQYDALLALSASSQTMEFHTLLWKCILATFEQPRAITTAITALHVYATILPTAAYCIRSRDFAFSSPQIALVVELVKAIFVITSHHKDASVDAPWPAVDEAMPLLCDLLQLPNTAPILELKLQTVNCLMVLQHPTYIEYLVTHNAASDLLTFLDYMLLKVRLEKTKKAGDVTPLLIGLNLLSTTHARFRDACKAAIFGATDLPLPSPEGLPMSPQPSAKFSLQEGLLSFMTSLDTDLKRCVSEFFFTLCEQNPLEFTQRTGMGNAVALLRTKGLV
ncbi:hypothetical protein SDRG_01362 [Saprolegnia diclina VS20]|uniref:Uncharacterized protein n=1 Tax=Saprolegnia diclina (strain VS20) TaxID=1156394 RepID=T0R350_SAPDV|nr:hypothetical protein SDRG_01362 [Saprolegnia diclina VS20]EQC41391.1 hypothetical protein SDRG_01362 [Saprolegnia diclina VS20]|eukprot:XP_008605105.1 hypothetical protein SDRG_01362 [Saprolegnia diclina VS20]